MKNQHESAYRGEEYQSRLAKHKITICGVGAIGSLLTDTLARIGSSNLKVIDFDRVSSQNTGTQLYGLADVGAMKVAALQNRIFRDTNIEIETVVKRLDEDNVKKLLKDSLLVVDCFDNSASRKILQDKWEALVSCPLIHAGLFEDYGEIIWASRYKVPQDQPTGDPCEIPLARNAIMMVVAILAEEILDYCLNDNPRFKSWSFTLKDLAIREIK